jgi:hypothetical protein
MRIIIALACTFLPFCLTKYSHLFLVYIVFSQWSGNGLVSYYLKDVLDTIGITNPTIQVRVLLPLSATRVLIVFSTQLLINGILAIWNLFWAVLAAFLCERLGRRFLFITSASGMLLFFTCQTISIQQYLKTANPAAAHAMIAFIFLFYASYE